MKTLLITLAFILPVCLPAQETKEYRITSVQHWKLWQDTIWVLTDTEENTDYVCMASFDTASLYAKVFLSDQEYHVRCWIEKKIINVDEFETTYAGKGELESNQRVVDVEFKAKYWDLTQLSVEEKDERIVLELVTRGP
ncbi:MAG: hypothetical protein AMS23_01230 [Bacteroides sp. SM1_62]|nr:MAG: hypothetical protein AMS26_08530 [Bacteroides sp. SM23_62]KPL26585.1 MAG: hypothetical protein AMS23_01230 [Bacteroides sp. SM1_62]